MTKLVHVSTEGKQDYATPKEFVKEVENRLGVQFLWDLAASEESRKAPYFYSQKEDALTKDWNEGMGSALAGQYSEKIDWACWLNPPFGNTSKFMQKCAFEGEKGLPIVTLTLSSLGTQWYKKWVKPFAISFVLEDRLMFEGCDHLYPKELMISVYGLGLTGLGWWKRNIK